MNDLYELREELAESNQILYELNKEIERLRSKVYSGNNIRNFYKNNQNIIRMNRKLAKEHMENLKDIEEYKDEYLELQHKAKAQNAEIQILQKENQKLKQKIKKREASRSPKKKIRGISDLRKSFGFHLKEVLQKNVNKKEEKIEEEEGEEETPGCDTDKKENEFERLKKLKMDSETVFYLLQEKINAYYKETDNQQTYIINYRNYINSLNNQIRSFRQQLRISIIGEANLNFFGDSGNKVNQLTKDMENTSYIINQINDSIYTIKNRTLKKGENILRIIQDNLLQINKSKKLSFWFLSNKMDIVINNIEDLKKLCQTLQLNLTDIITLRKKIEKNIYNLKLNVEKFMGNYRESKKQIHDAIRKTIRKTTKNIFNSINKSLRHENVNEEEDENEKMIENIMEEEGEGKNLMKI